MTGQTPIHHKSGCVNVTSVCLLPAVMCMWLSTDCMRGTPSGRTLNWRQTTQCVRNMMFLCWILCILCILLVLHILLVVLSSFRSTLSVCAVVHSQTSRQGDWVLGLKYHPAKPLSHPRAASLTAAHEHRYLAPAKALCHILLLFHPLGHQADIEEGVHPGVLSWPQVHVGLLHACQAGLSEQDVCQGMNE